MNIDFKKLSEKKFKLLDKESGYDKKIILKKFQLPNGMIENFFIDNAKDSVQIFAITRDEKIICVEQFRAGTEKIELELPGGGLEAGEDAGIAADRELLEETTFSGKSPIFLAKIPYSPYSTGHRYSYLIMDCVPTKKQDLDPNEFLKIKLVPIEDFRLLMREGKVRGFECAYLALDKLGRLKF